MKTTKILAEFVGKTLLVEPSEARRWAMRADLIAEGQQAATVRSRPNTPGDVAVIPMVGMVTQRASWISDVLGWATTEGMAAQFRQAMADPNVKAVLFDVDSPGGIMDGVPELSAEVFEARGQKPILAVARSLMASAAYWIGSAADEVIASPSSDVGSIGVWMATEDWSGALEQMGIKMNMFRAPAFKAEGAYWEPLSEEAAAFLQSTIDSAYGDFVAAVARNRGVAAGDVRNGYGQGRALPAKDAKAAGLVDRVDTWENTLARFGAKPRGVSAGLARAQMEAAAR